MQFIFAILALIMVILFTKNLFTLIFSLENYKVHKKRLRQLQFQKKKEEADIAGLIDAVTKPIINYFFSRFKPKKMDVLALDLKMAKWDKFFTPIQFRALNLLLKIIGVIAFSVLYNVSGLMAGIWGVSLFFGMGFLLRNSIKNRKERLLSSFPDFIRITEGYLTSNVPFSKAVSESIKYVGDEWKPILQNFVIESELNGIHEALDGLKREIDMFEVREFVALVKLTLEQGGDAKESFSAQADKIRELQMDMIAVKIGKRQTMGVILQGPLLLCNLLVFGLPTIGSMTNFTSM